ncbi:MAG: hypothetical protein IJO55_04000 [Lachnospiraceae bacterium]|nr:hypothetical protein [Lachnospiraceae bacterium]
MTVDRVDIMIKKEGAFREWDNKEAFMAFREEMLRLYDELTEDEQYDVDETMIMEHISMIYHCYVGDED